MGNNNENEGRIDKRTKTWGNRGGTARTSGASAPTPSDSGAPKGQINAMGLEDAARARGADLREAERMLAELPDSRRVHAEASDDQVLAQAGFMPISVNHSASASEIVRMAGQEREDHERFIRAAAASPDGGWGRTVVNGVERKGPDPVLQWLRDDAIPRVAYAVSRAVRAGYGSVTEKIPVRREYALLTDEELEWKREHPWVWEPIPEDERKVTFASPEEASSDFSLLAAVLRAYGYTIRVGDRAVKGLVSVCASWEDAEPPRTATMNNGSHGFDPGSVNLNEAHTLLLQRLGTIFVRAMPGDFTTAHGAYANAYTVNHKDYGARMAANAWLIERYQSWRSARRAEYLMGTLRTGNWILWSSAPDTHGGVIAQRAVCEAVADFHSARIEEARSRGDQMAGRSKAGVRYDPSANEWRVELVGWAPKEFYSPQPALDPADGE